MKPLWAIQKACINDTDAKGMIEAIKNLNLQMEYINVTPFDYSNIPDIEYKGPIIPYGGTRMIDAIMRTKKWACYFNDNFSYKIYLEKFGKHMFNSDGQHMLMSEFCPSNYPKGEYIFVRPDKDLKEFAGFNTKPEDFMTWYRKMERQDWEIGENTEIIVAKASKIGKEWRIFVVDGEPIDGSLYRSDHYQQIVRAVPDNVFDFVIEMCKIWTPSPIFVMDVCELNGELFILELGDFHSAGWYATDKQKIIGAISDFTEENFV